MSIDERKNLLIHWIKNLKDESVINQIEDVRSMALTDLPSEITLLLEKSNKESAQSLTEHTNSKELLKKK